MIEKEYSILKPEKYYLKNIISDHFEKNIIKEIKYSNTINIENIISKDYSQSILKKNKDINEYYGELSQIITPLYPEKKPVKVPFPKKPFETIFEKIQEAEEKPIVAPIDIDSPAQEEVVPAVVTEEVQVADVTPEPIDTTPEIEPEVEVVTSPVETTSKIKKPSKVKYGFNPQFKTEDPHKNNPNRFNNQQAKRTGLLVGYLDGTVSLESFDEQWENNNLILDREVINAAIDDMYQRFSALVAKSPKVSEIDKNDVKGETLAEGIKPLKQKMKLLIARYMVQILNNYPKMTENQFTERVVNTINAGVGAYVKTYGVDMPLYDKVFDEFDGYREKGRYPQEVYLGRDGIYAYVGRRAQDIARRRKIHWSDRVMARENGNPVDIKPKYLIYPRFYRDYLAENTKKEYLEQEGIGKFADPLFYDTGYTGTIPEQIMNLTGFSVTDREGRIRLLSATWANRRIKGISENARGDIVESIEHNAKIEEPSDGLFKDPKTGKIRPIARPTSPEEQFMYMMVREAIVRHYYLKDAINYQAESSSHQKFESQDYQFTIQQEYKELLPSEFVQNPSEFIDQHGTVLKSSKGEGEYPDEHIVLVTLTNGQEIVVKKIELKKAKEAKKEFHILQKAQKAGLETAKPVGFIEGKDESAGSYVLMTKVDGISGRKFEKQMRESGKYSNDEINRFLREISDLNAKSAKSFREALLIDKQWRFKDLIIQFDENTKKVVSVVPIDWERAKYYDPEEPEYVQEYNVGFTFQSDLGKPGKYPQPQLI